MVCGYLPFEDTNTTNLYKKILAANYKLPKFVSNEVSELIKGILHTDPRKRFTIEDIRKHPWFYTYKVFKFHIIRMNFPYNKALLSDLIGFQLMW